MLVPEVSGPGAIELEPVRAAVRKTAAEQADRTGAWWALGADDGAPDGPDRPLPGGGSFGGFGVDRRVALYPDADTAACQHLPTAMLLAGWVRELVPDPERVAIKPVVTRAGATPQECRVVGAALAARFADDPEPSALLVVGDGSIHLGDRAPGGGRAVDAVAVQQEIDAALASGEPAAVRALDWDRCARWGAGGRGAWEVAAVCAPGSARAVVEYSGAPLGVGYNVVTWRFG